MVADSPLYAITLLYDLTNNEPIETNKCTPILPDKQINDMESTSTDTTNLADLITYFENLTLNRMASRPTIYCHNCGYAGYYSRDCCSLRNRLTYNNTPCYNN